MSVRVDVICECVCVFWKPNIHAHILFLIFTTKRIISHLFFFSHTQTLFAISEKKGVRVCYIYSEHVKMEKEKSWKQEINHYMVEVKSARGRHPPPRTRRTTGGHHRVIYELHDEPHRL